MARTIRSKGHTALVEALLENRKACGLSQEELARRLRCQQSLIARIEGGERRVDVIELIVICRALSACPEDIIRFVALHTESDHTIN